MDGELVTNGINGGTNVIQDRQPLVLCVACYALLHLVETVHL